MTDMRPCIAVYGDELGDADIDAILPSQQWRSGASDADLRAGYGARLEAQNGRMIMNTAIPIINLRHQLAESLSAKVRARRATKHFCAACRRGLPQHARTQPLSTCSHRDRGISAAEALAARALGISLDKQAVVFEMGSLLASLQNA